MLTSDESERENLLLKLTEPNSDSLRSICLKSTLVQLRIFCCRPRYNPLGGDTYARGPAYDVFNIQIGFYQPCLLRNEKSRMFLESRYSQGFNWQALAPNPQSPNPQTPSLNNVDS